MNDARKHADDVRGASALVLAATRGITELVEEMQRTIASGPAILGKPLELPVRAITSAIHGPIRGVTRIVGAGIDAVLTQLAPLLGASVPGAEREAILAALNGVLGDYLSATANPLAIELSFRSDGARLPLAADALRAALPEACSKLLVLVHGCAMNDRQWERNGHDHGRELARELGYTPVYVHYNSGLHISENGRRFAHALEALARAWPVALDEINLLGHSMGGLVARSACHAAEAERLGWRSRLRRLACLGSPHHGSAFERGGNLLHAVLAVNAYSAPFTRLAQIRSAGVTDLRYGNVLDADWQGRGRFVPLKDTRAGLSLPAGVDCYALAGTTAKTRQEKLPGDGLVSVNSALGRHRRKALTLRFPKSHRAIALDTGHLELLGREHVYPTLSKWFGSVS